MVSNRPSPDLATAPGPQGDGAHTATSPGETELRALLDETSELVCTTGADGRVNFVNRAWRQALGYTPAEAAAIEPTMFVAPEHRAFYRDVARRLVRGETVEDFEAVLIAKDGHRVVCRGRASARMEGGRCVATRAIYRDVTAERQADAIRTRLAATLEATSDFVGISTRDGQIVFMNRAGRRMVGLPGNADLSAIRTDDLHPADALDTLFGVALPAVMEHGRWEGESLLTAVGGQEIPVSMVMVSHPSMRPGESPYFISTVMRDLRERMAAEGEARDSEARLRGVVDALDEGVLITDFDDRVLFVNQRLSEMSGYAAEELLGQLAYELLLPPEQHAVMRERTASRREGSRERYELEIVRRDGSRLWVEGGAATFYDGAGRAVGTVGSLTDITARKRAERTLERERQFLEAVLENLSDGVVACDAEGRLTLSNRALREYQHEPPSPDDAAARFALFHADGRTPLRRDEEPLHRALDEGRVSDVELVIAPAGAEPRTVIANGRRFTDAEGNTLGAVVAMHDVTARQAAETALRASETLFRTVLENLRAVAITLDATGRLTFVNEHLLALTGWTREDAIGADWFDRFLPPGNAMRGQFARMVANDEIPPHHENEVVAADGSVRLIAWDNVPLRDAEGRVAGAASVGRDITEQRRVQRLKDQLIATVSHEVRNPLGAIRSALQLLPRQLTIPDGNPRELLDMAVRSTDRLLRLTNNLLDIERAESGGPPMNPVAVGVDPLIAASLELVRHAADARGVMLAHEADERSAGALVWADVDGLTQVLTNLVGNAIKFSPTGSAVTVAATPGADGEVRFTVRDRGRGVPADKLEMIFERFEQVDPGDARERQGAGLGLAISRAIVRQHGGRIWAEALDGGGTVFIFTLPGADHALAGTDMG